jgi:hypothetical protein
MGQGDKTTRHGMGEEKAEAAKRKFRKNHKQKKQTKTWPRIMANIDKKDKKPGQNTGGAKMDERKEKIYCFTARLLLLLLYYPWIEWCVFSWWLSII